MLNRRCFLKAMPPALALSGYPVHGFTKDAVDGRIIVIMLQGGMDGLLAVPPIGDDDLYKQRKALVAANPLKLNPLFGIHPNFQNFSRMLKSNEASIIHATSFPYTGRSHFEGQNISQIGLKKAFSVDTGWLGRAMDNAKITGRAMSLDAPLLIRGALEFDNYYPASIEETSIPKKDLLELIKNTHDGTAMETFEKLSQSLIQGSDEFRARDPLSLAAKAGDAMRRNDGPRVAVLTIPEFDDHSSIGSTTGHHPDLFTLLDSVFGQLKKSLKETWNNSIVLTTTEFGRTVQENGSEGTDHGYGSVGLLAGGLIKQSSVVANWPGLSNKALFEKRDLYATIDYRSVCAACIEAAFGLDHDLIIDKVFQDKKIKRTFHHIFG
ncbi:DUF1501 domain-containing protein [Amylibacter sp.]|nr:DUF1501 domain-containing protein [Amylibacter sp.]